MEGQVCILLNEKNGHPFFIQLLELTEQLVLQHGCQAHRRLIQKQDFAAGHQRPANRQHLLFATREGFAALVAALLKARKKIEDPLVFGIKIGTLGTGVGGNL